MSVLELHHVLYFFKYISVPISINCFIQIELSYTKSHFIFEGILSIFYYYFNNMKLF